MMQPRATMLLLGVFLLFPIIGHATPHSLPSALQNTLKRAFDTKDAFIIEAVKKEILRQSPDQKERVESYLHTLESPPTPPPNKQKPKKWSGEIEAGFNISAGNSETFYMNAATAINHETSHWGNTLKLKAYNSEEEGNRTSEEYRAEAQTRYKLANDDYIFGEGEYVNDRFSGFTYRISELLGYGRTLINHKNFTLTGEAGLGARQTKLTDDSTDNTFLQKLKANARWQITKRISLGEELSTSFAGNTIITTSDTALKTQILDKLYLKLGVNLEHISDVPAGRKRLDSKTSFNVVYGF